MPERRHHRTPRWLNTGVRIMRLTVPQWLALAGGCGLGGLLYWLLSVVAPWPGPSALWLFGRLLLAGIVGGVLCVVFYALADDRREPFVRQALGYPFRRHTYLYVATEDPDARTTSPGQPARLSRRTAILAPARRLAARTRSTRGGGGGTDAPAP